MWQELHKAFRDEELLMLIDKVEYEQRNLSVAVSLSSEEKIELEMPYIQTALLINEAINLTATYKSNGLVSLSEGTNPNNRKDRIVALGYGNTVMNKIINKIEKNNNDEDEDWDNFTLVV
jgi:hypothetical protein